MARHEFHQRVFVVVYPRGKKQTRCSLIFLGRVCGAGWLPARLLGPSWAPPPPASGGPPSHAFPGQRQSPQPQPTLVLLKPLLYPGCAASPSTALTHLTEGDTLYSQAAHALFGNRSFILLWLLAGEVGLKLGSMQKILADNANSRRKKQRGG